MVGQGHVTLCKGEVWYGVAKVQSSKVKQSRGKARHGYAVVKRGSVRQWFGVVEQSSGKALYGIV